MKRICFIVLTNLLLPYLVYTQNIDKSLYQGIHLTEAYEIRKDNPQRTQYYRSLAHFYTTYINNFMGYTQVVFYEDGPQYVSFNYYSNFPKIRPFQVVTIYYHFIRKEYTHAGIGYESILDHIELTDKYLITGTRYIAMENLRLRNKPNLSGAIIRIISRDEWVVVLEEGNEETIDGITSIWVKVRSDDHTEGWCFGGYLGLDFLREH
jgi:hypothetical protein